MDADRPAGVGAEVKIYAARERAEAIPADRATYAQSPAQCGVPFPTDAFEGTR